MNVPVSRVARVSALAEPARRRPASVDASRRRVLVVGSGAVAVLGTVAARIAPARAQARPLTVFAAASLKDALDAVLRAWEQAGHARAVASYAATSALARQIEQGAPADAFMSADLEWMDWLDARGLLRPGTRTNLLGNRLVLIAAAGNAARIDLVRGVDLVSPLRGGRLALADTRSVPAGKYALAALRALGAWDALAAHTAQTENVRSALALVARGEAPYGIVYETDAQAEPGVRIVARFPADSHPPIVYPVALVRDGRHPDAGAFLAFLRSDAARTRFEAQGFSVLS